MESLEVEDAKQPFLHDRQNASTTPAHNPTRWKTWAYAFPPLVVLSLLCVWLVLRSSSAGDQVRPGELSKSALLIEYVMPGADIDLKMNLGYLWYNAP